jgi:hypothetical protein
MRFPVPLVAVGRLLLWEHMSRPLEGVLELLVIGWKQDCFPFWKEEKKKSSKTNKKSKERGNTRNEKLKKRKRKNK